MLKEDLLDVAEEAVKLAEKEGADQAEAYTAASKSVSIKVENNSVKAASHDRDMGCGIRSVIGKRVGFAYVTNLEASDVQEIAAESVALACASLPDSDFETLPSPDKDYPTINGIFDSSIKNLMPDDAAGYILRAVDATLDATESTKTAVEASFTATSLSRAIVNSLGISGFEESTAAFLFSSPTIRTKNDQNSSYEYQISRSLDDIDPEWVGRSAGKLALEGLGGKTVDEGHMPVIFTPLAVGRVIGYGFGGAIDAEEVQDGRSYISDDIGNQIASKKLSIVDDATITGGISTRPFDAEGVPSRKTVVLSDGVLKNLLHNSYTANRAGVENTANASRDSYSGTPAIATSNFVIKPDQDTLDDFISEMDRAIVCRNTADRPNMTTGELSAMIMEGFYVEEGEIKHPLKNTLIGINMRDLLSQVIRVGDDVRTTMSVVSPSIVVENVRVTSG
ncbi:MAG: TldD/PmbA family protein [Candidatus Thorarchaeota archaeon]|nr:TldD/PmbA family protein [Candidatus Thorarchaeota archaeon]